MYSGSRRRFTDMSPAFSRHKSEMIPTSKNRIVYRSKKFMLLTRQDEEILAEPLLLEKTLSLIPDSEHESRLDPSLEQTNPLTRQVSKISSRSNNKSQQPFFSDAQLRLVNKIQTSSVFYIILSYLPQLEIIQTQLVNKRFYNLYVPVVSTMVTTVGVTPYKMRHKMRCMILPG